MPVSLTPQQQAQIDAANQALANAKAILDAATSDAYNKHSALGRCVSGKGANKPLHANELPTFPAFGRAKDCDLVDFIKDCKTDCCSKETCIGRINDYNNSVNSYLSAQTGYNTAKDNLEKVMEAIAKDPTVAANTAIQVTEIEGDKKREQTKWLLFGLTVLVISIGAVLLIVRLGKSKGATT